nr:GIY-YIG endonuclease [Cordyceps militaris]
MNLKNKNLKIEMWYKNCNLEKVQLLTNNKNKSGIYCWINNINNKIYIGSSINLTNRLYKYYNVNLLSTRRTSIYNALLKYGYDNFSFVILEYITDKKELINKEQYYINLLEPEYNILKKAGSSLGFKHNKETLYFFKNTRKLSEEAKENLSLASTGRILSEETRLKISSKRKGIKLSNETKAKLSKSATNLRGIKIKVVNILTSEELYFDSLTDAGLHLNVSRTAIAKALKNNSIIKKNYIIIQN